MDVVIGFLTQQPLLALFLVLAAGYAIGAVDIKGLSLGVGAVLFSGLFLGAIAPKCQPPALVGTLGLVMFLYGLGVQFGNQFFAGLAGKTGRRYNLLAALGLAAATAVCLVEVSVLHVSYPLIAGLFAGAGTSSPTMQAAMEAAGTSEPAIGYSAAYPFGIVGAILCMYVVQLIAKPRLEVSSQRGLQTSEVAVRSSQIVGRTLGQVLQQLPRGVQVLVVRTGHENRHPQPNLVLGEDDVLFLGSPDAASLDAARKMIGERAMGRVVHDRSALDYLRVFVSKPALVGTRVTDLRLPSGLEATIAHVQRGDTDMLITPDLVLESGDRVGLLADRATFPAVRKFFGDSMRGTTEFSYVALGVGMVLGVLLGSVPVPVPVLGSFKVGVAGGSLIVALILGKLGRTGALTWTMPFSANLTLRNFGLSIFLAQVGMSSGAPFVAVIRNSGPTLVIAGACVLLALVLTPLLVGHYVLRIPFDDLLGVTSGVTGNPAILAYGFRSYPSDQVEVCYAMIFPAATILKIVVAQVLIAIGRGG